jgi:hypothetical protein
MLSTLLSLVGPVGLLLVAVLEDIVLALLVNRLVAVPLPKVL